MALALLRWVVFLNSLSHIDIMVHNQTEFACSNFSMMSKGINFNQYWHLLLIIPFCLIHLFPNYFPWKLTLYRRINWGVGCLSRLSCHIGNTLFQDFHDSGSLLKYVYLSLLQIILNKVLLVGSKTSTWIGEPVVPNAAVHAVVEEQVRHHSSSALVSSLYMSLFDISFGSYVSMQTKDKKVIVFKYKKKKNYRRNIGHRQVLKNCFWWYLNNRLDWNFLNLFFRQ